MWDSRPISGLRTPGNSLAAVIGLFGLFLAVDAHAGQIAQGTNQTHIDYAANPRFESVGWIGGWLGDTYTISGSFALISPHWALTAAHVIDDSRLRWFGSFDTNIYEGLPAYRSIDAVYPYPGYVDDNGGGNSDDIGLIHFAEPVTDITPAKIYQDAVLPGTHGYFSGYGELRYYPSTVGTYDGIKRAGENIIDRIGWPTIVISSRYMLAEFDDRGPPYGNVLPLEMGGSPGDSGSGWFADLDGESQLIGITSFGRGYSMTGTIRLDIYRDWINEVSGIFNVPSLLGDANHDCQVGTADYSVWAAQFGQSGAGLSADFDANGSVGAGDYTIWAANFGESCSPLEASVPEPETAWLACLAMISFLVVAVRRRNFRAVQVL